MNTRGLKILMILVLGAVAIPGVADELTLEAFDIAAKSLEVPEPTNETDPLAMNAALVATNPSEGDSVIAVLKLRLMPTWYIYEDVPASQPFIETDWILEAGPGLEIIDDWAGPPATPHKTLAKTRVHASGKDALLFFRELEVTAKASSTKVKVGLRYQVCNPEYCLPPKTKTKELTLDFSNG